MREEDSEQTRDKLCRLRQTANRHTWKLSKRMDVQTAEGGK